jgi:uncharacterized protein with HEPN domain
VFVWGICSSRRMRLCSFAAGRSRVDIDRDRMLLHSLVRSIEIIGEAAVNISREFRDTVPAIPRAKLAGMRNRVVHAYHDIDPDIVWDTTTKDLPSLVAELTNLLAEPEP